MTAQVARPVTRLAVTVATGALAVGAGLVGAGIAWTPARHDAPAISRGGQLYAAECARCHGVRLGGGAARTPPAPPLGVAGHTWRHTDAELAAIVARGAGGGMPGFAERLGPGEISDVLAHVRSHWPTSIRAYQGRTERGQRTGPS